jgi:hypothetical protein
MSDMDPDGMDPEFDGEGDLDYPENISDAASTRGQQAKPAGTPGSPDKESPIRSRRDDWTESESEDEEDEDMEPRSTPRSGSQPPHNRRETDRDRPSPPGDRRR